MRVGHGIGRANCVESLRHQRDACQTTPRDRGTAILSDVPRILRGRRCRLLFVVLEAHGASWDRAIPMRRQPEWDAHAAFMDALVDDGFIVLGGPLGEDGALLIVHSDTEAAARERLAADPWERSGLLEITWIEPYEVLLGALG